MAALTPQMLAAIQAAGQAGAGAARPGASDASIGAAMQNALTNSGLFSPEELQAVNATWSTTGNWGNGAPTPDVWDNQIQNAIQGVLGNQQTVADFQPAQNTPAQQALAPVAQGGQGYNPLQPAYVNPTYLSQQQIDSLGAQPTINALVGANQPQFQQQDQQMMQMLATAGLTPSSTAGQTAFNNLAQQQLAGMDPSIAAAIQNSQANQLSAGQFNATTANTAGQNNANAFNNAGNTYFNALTGAYNTNANAFNQLNTAGLAGAQNLAGGQQSIGGNLAQGQQSTFPIYSNPFGGGAAAAFGSAGSYPQPTGTNPTPAGTNYGNYNYSEGFG